MNLQPGNRGVVISPKIVVNGQNVLLTTDVEIAALRRYVLYWDNIAYAYPNGLGKPNLDALDDLRFLFESNRLSLHDVPVTTSDIGMENVPTPIPQSEARYLIEKGEPTPSNPSGTLFLGTPVEVWPELSTFAQVKLVQSIREGIWTVGECNSRLSAPILRGANGALLETTLYACLPVPDDGTPLLDILEFRENRRSELLQFRKAIDALFETATSKPDAVRGLNQAKEALELALLDIGKALSESKLKTFFTTLRLYLNLSDTKLASTLLGSMGAAGTGLPLVVGAAVGLGVNTLLTFANRQLEGARGLPSSLVDFAYVYDVKKHWPRASI